jgi:hypothetical protein
MVNIFLSSNPEHDPEPVPDKIWGEQAHRLAAVALRLQDLLSDFEACNRNQDLFLEGFDCRNALFRNGIGNGEERGRGDVLKYSP